MADTRLRTTGTGETPALPRGPGDFSQTLGMGGQGRGRPTRTAAWGAARRRPGTAALSWTRTSRRRPQGAAPDGCRHPRGQWRYRTRDDQRDDRAVEGYIGPCARGVGDARGDHFGLRPSTSRQRQHKLVAAIASGKIAAPTTLAQHVRHTPQHVIAGQVAVDIVEELEVVDVEHQYRAWLAIDYPAAMRAAVRARSSQR